jgi:membrane-associated protease RseP (regulator of RpoE activity)
MALCAEKTFLERAALAKEDILSFWCSLVGATLLVLFVHELGHFLAARWCGVRVVRFSIGLGPEIFGFTDRFGTHWSFALLPVGGGVGVRERDLSDEPIIPPSGISDAFSDKPIGQRVAIYLAGPMFSLAGAMVLAGGVILLRGDGALQDALSYSEPAFIRMMIGLSILFGVFNLLPIPPLDGGKLVFFGIEAFLGKPIAGHIQSSLSLLGTIFLMLLTLLLVAFGASQIIWA